MMSADPSEHPMRVPPDWATNPQLADDYLRLADAYRLWAPAVESGDLSTSGNDEERVFRCARGLLVDVTHATGEGVIEVTNRLVGDFPALEEIEEFWRVSVLAQFAPLPPRGKAKFPAAFYKLNKAYEGGQPSAVAGFLWALPFYIGYVAKFQPSVADALVEVVKRDFRIVSKTEPIQKSIELASRPYNEEAWEAHMAWVGKYTDNLERTALSSANKSRLTEGYRQQPAASATGAKESDELSPAWIGAGFVFGPILIVLGLIFTMTGFLWFVGLPLMLAGASGIYGGVVGSGQKAANSSAGQKAIQATKEAGSTIASEADKTRLRARAAKVIGQFEMQRDAGALSAEECDDRTSRVRQRLQEQLAEVPSKHVASPPKKYKLY